MTDRGFFIDWDGNAQHMLRGLWDKLIWRRGRDQNRRLQSHLSGHGHHGLSRQWRHPTGQDAARSWLTETSRTQCGWLRLKKAAELVEGGIEAIIAQWRGRTH